jgi:hypothetical protein
LFGQQRGLQRIGILSAARLPQGRHMIDVDAERDARAG